MKETNYGVLAASSTVIAFKLSILSFFLFSNLRKKIPIISNGYLYQHINSHTIICCLNLK